MTQPDLLSCVFSIEGQLSDMVVGYSFSLFICMDVVVCQFIEIDLVEVRNVMGLVSLLVPEISLSVMKYKWYDCQAVCVCNS